MSELEPRRHAQRSKHLAAGFSMTHVIKSEIHVSDAIRLLKKRLSQFSQTKTEIHLDQWFNYLAFDIIGEVLFSKSFGFLEAVDADTAHLRHYARRYRDSTEESRGPQRRAIGVDEAAREESGNFSEKELYGCVNMTVGAGADTVSASIQSFFYHIMRHPRIQKTVRKEIKDAGLTDDVISYADAANLPFLQACVSAQHGL
ncbi:hypothetical protein SLS60_000484 [Paraconiothyrium brasiliense]|uniref:Cytochrome P450 n=1 Tax=Paraconiothyrium brasiliense TaxID=300254 RepID=A0ABR3S6E7_9PLEO